MAKIKTRRAARSTLPKTPTGIQGLDEITGGGLPRGRPTLVVGSAGAGKTLFSLEFLIRGAIEFDEPGVMIAFEEMPDELAQNVRSLGFDLKALEDQKKLVVDHVRIERAEIEETGEYDLEALFVRLGYAIDSIHAKRIVLDTLEALFAGLTDTAILRAELRRLFRWLKDRGVTAVITAEAGDGTLTRHGLEEYVSDAVIVLDQRIENQLATRRLRILKYRGSSHGTNEYPFLINKEGFQVLPITSLGLAHTALTERVSSGLPELDDMLGGKGFYRGSTILFSGAAGTGKTSFAAQFVDAAARRGEKSIYFAFEESESQIIRNMRSIGIDLAPHVKQGLLRFETNRPTQYGLEMHLAQMYQAIREWEPRIVVIDPASDFMAMGLPLEIKSMLTRLIDFLKSKHITSLLTSLTTLGESLEQTSVGISSLIDTWLLVRELEANGERTRGLYVLKSRGMEHSNQIREFVFTPQGVKLVEVFVGPGGVLTGAARIAQQAQDEANAIERNQEYARDAAVLQSKREAVLAQIAALQAQLAGEEERAARALADARNGTERQMRERLDIAHRRQGGTRRSKNHKRAAARNGRKSEK